MPHRWLLATVLLLLSFTASAAGPGAVRKQIELSMRVTGTIEVAEDGSVRTSVLDKGDQLPKGVLDFVQKNIDAWQFEPVILDGKKVAIRNKMSLLLVAKKQDNDEYLIRMQAASFDPYKVEDGHEIASKTMTPPRFPMAASRNGVTGTVYLVLKIGADGKVQDAIAEQVNLRIVDSENQMDRHRKLLSDAALSAAKAWEFIPPTAGEHAADPYWSIRVPVDFLWFSEVRREYGKWQAYVPGPRQRYPWAENEDGEYSPEALAAGSVHMVGKGGLRLLTPLSTEG